MEYVALYRKYRPKKLDEIYGQKYIVDIVKNSVVSDRFFHAYLFSGPRGTGKTTIAKLISKIVNCSNLNGYDPCDQCDSCRLFNEKSNPDIVEIDAASNNGVDEIRSIREKAMLMPSVSKYKVYIIDEVHMLSVSAFNALLKTLEEPPKHVIFILATTELDRVPETIVSRCQCYDFKRISVDEIEKCLKNICECENFTVDQEVLKLIAVHCNGGLRDSIGLLDKLVSYSDNITVDLFYDVVGLISNDVIYDIYSGILDGNIKLVYEMIEKMVNSGKSVESITEQILEYLKESVVNKTNKFFDSTIKMIEGFSDIAYAIKFSSNALLIFEIGVLKIINSLGDTKIISREIMSDENVASSDAESKSNDKDLKLEKVAESKDEQMVAKVVEKFDIIINNAFALANKELKNNIVNKWSGFYDYVHNREFSSIVSYFLDSTVQVVGEKDVIISADYQSVIDNAVQNLTKLELLFNLVMGKFYNLAFVLSDDWIKLRDKYVSDVKSGKNYNYIETNVEKNVIIDDETNDLPEIVKTANNVFGDDIVEIK